MGYNPNYAKKAKAEEKSDSRWRPRATVNMGKITNPDINRSGKGDRPLDSAVNRAAKGDRPLDSAVNRAAKVDLPSKPAVARPKPKARPVVAAASAPAAPKPKAKPVTFSGNWKGAAPTEMQKRAGARVDRGGGILGALKRMRKSK
jgi:hypothetical protein